MRILKKADDLIGYATVAGAIISGALNLVILFVTVAEVLNRNVFNSSFLGASEITQYCMTGVVFFGLAYSMRHDVFVRVDFVYSKLKGRVKSIVDTFLLAVALFYTCKMVSFVYPLIINALERGTDSGTALHFPLWIHRTTIVAGLCILIMELAILLIAAFISIFKPNDPVVRYVLGNHNTPFEKKDVPAKVEEAKKE